MDWIYWLDLVGVFVFAISGILCAIDNDFDLVGSLVIGFVTALGGGTLSDLLIGRVPVGWMKDTHYLWAVLVALFVSYLFKKEIMKLKKSLFLFDTIGIAVFTVLGVQKAIDYNLSDTICVIVGVVSAVFGGVIRDVLCNEVPLIFRKEIYASACVLGGIVFLTLSNLGTKHEVAVLLSTVSVIMIRYLAVKFNWSLKIKP